MKFLLEERTDRVPLPVKGAGTPKDITHETGALYRAHRDKLQQVLVAMIRTGKDTEWAEARLRNSGLFETEPLAVRLVTARSASFEGTALLQKGRELVKACFEARRT